MISHPILTWGKQATPGAPPASAVQGAFVRGCGTNRGILSNVYTYRNTIIEPQQTDKSEKE